MSRVHLAEAIRSRKFEFEFSYVQFKTLTKLFCMKIIIFFFFINSNYYFKLKSRGGQ